LRELISHPGVVDPPSCKEGPKMGGTLQMSMKKAKWAHWGAGLLAASFFEAYQETDILG